MAGKGVSPLDHWLQGEHDDEFERLIHYLLKYASQPVVAGKVQSERGERQTITWLEIRHQPNLDVH